MKEPRDTSPKLPLRTELARPFQITPRLDADGQQLFGVPEYNDAFSYMGHRLGLTGTFHVLEVVDALDMLLDTKPEGMALALEEFRRALYEIETALPKLETARNQLGRATRIIKKLG